VKFAQVLQSALQKSAVEPVGVQAETRDQPSPKQKSPWWDSVFGVFTSQKPALKWGLAAGIVALILTAGWMTFESARKRQQVYQSQAERDASAEQEHQEVIKPSPSIVANPEEESARLREVRERLEREKQQLARQQRREQKESPDVHIASFVLTPQMRSGSQLTSISIPPKTTRIAMRLELEPNNHAEYRVSLLDEVNHQTLWRSGRLRARDGKSLAVNFSPSLLRPRRYSLQVSGWSVNGESEPMGNYPFEVVR
jgi:type II secretory pathway component PulJ